MHRKSQTRFSLSWQDIALPLVLVVTGLILVGGDWLGLFSLDRIANYWPGGVILVGLTAIASGEPSEVNTESVRHAR